MRPLIGAVALLHVLAQEPPRYTVVNAPQDTSTRTQASVFSSEFGQGIAWFVGGRDSDGRTLASAVSVQGNVAAPPTVATVPAPFTPFAQGTNVYIGQTGRDSTGDINNMRTFVLGGFNGSTLTMNVASFDGATATWTPSVNTVMTGVQAWPVPRFGAAAAYLTRCDMSNPAAPKPCVLMFGGQSATGLLNDLYALWITETPMRWELITADTATPAAGQPSRRVNAVGAASADGGTLFVYGGVTATGPTSDMFAMAPAGFPDATIPEMINVALRTQAAESTTQDYWGGAGPAIAVDGREDKTDFCCASPPSPPNPPFGCTHTQDWLPTHWWRTRLNSTQNIDAVRMVPRSDGWGWRTRAYELYTSPSLTLPVAGGGPPLADAVAKVTDAIQPNMANAPVMVYFNAPRPTTFFWIYLPDLGYNRALSLCEVQLFVKRRWIWRQMSGVTNVALGRPARQSTLLTDWGGGEPNRAVDGGVTSHYDATKTCTHTAGVPPGVRQFWQVDLGDVYDLASVTIWPRQDCCTWRNSRMIIFAGVSRNSYEFDQRCFGPGDLNVGLTAASNPPNPLSGFFRNYACPTRARYVTVAKGADHTGWDDSTIMLCEVQVFAQAMVNQPAARRDFSSVIFRGSLIIYGGTDSNGFRTDDLRFFDLNARRWLPAIEPLGTQPSARAFIGLAVLNSNALVLHGGTTNGDVASDMTVLTFRTCPVIDMTSGVATVRCTGGGNVCVFTCFPSGGWIDRNQGRPVICRDDGQIEGFNPPCINNGIAGQPLSFTASVDIATNTSVTVGWAAPANLGFYAFQGASALRGYRVRAVPREFFEDFSQNRFIDEARWQVLTQERSTGNFYYFSNGRLVMDAGAGSDTWQNIAGPPPGMDAVQNRFINGNRRGDWNVRNMFVLYREFPTQVDPAGEWAMEVEMEPLLMAGDSLASIGLVDVGNMVNGTGQFANIRIPDIVFYFGIRYTDWGANGATATIVMETNGGIIGKTFPALSTKVTMRIERVLNEERDREGNWVYRFSYKYDAGGRWTRIYAVATRYQVMNVGWNTTTQRLTGVGMQPQNLRPYLGIKCWNGNDYARASTMFRYLRITPGLIQPRPGTTLILPPAAVGGTITGLSRGVTYDVQVQALTDAGYGTPASAALTPPPAPSIADTFVWGSRVASTGQPAFSSSQAWGGFNEAGNNGDWLVSGGQTHSNCNWMPHDWWGVDLGVEYAAVKSIRIRNRCEVDWLASRIRYTNFYVGDDNRGALTTNQATPMIRWDRYFSNTPWNNGPAAGWNIYGTQGVFNWPIPLLWEQRANPANNWILQHWPHTGANWTSNPEYCQARIPTPGEGRYFYAAANTNECLHFTELQVEVANSCPARTGLGAVVPDTAGGRSCNGNSPFGTTCAHTCINGEFLQSGNPIVRCNGEVWTGGFSARPVCAPTCSIIEPAAYTERLTHVIIDENFVGMGANNFRSERLATLNPVYSPLSTVWQFGAFGAQAVGRLGLPEEATLVFVTDKIRAMDQFSVFTITTSFTTNDQAGVLFRIVDQKNFYRVTVDAANGFHMVEAVVGGVPRLMADGNFPLQRDAVTSLRVSVNGYFVNVTINGRLIIQTSDRQFASGYAGLFASSTATFTQFRFDRDVRACAGVQEGERCLTTCQAGLISRGAIVRTCQAGGVWNPAPSDTLPGLVECTLDPPTFPSTVLNVRENSQRNALVGSPLVAQSSSSLFPVQFDMIRTYTVTGGTLRPLTPPTVVTEIMNNLYSVDFCTGQVKVRQSNVLDYEMVRQYLLTVRAYILGFSSAFTDRNITVNIIDVDEPPFILATTLSFPENSTTGSVLGSVQWWDPENSTVAWTADIGDSRFRLDAATGTVSIVATPVNGSAGALTMHTGPTAPLSFENGRGRAALSVSIRQTNGDLSLGASGDVFLEPVDQNDAPFFNPLRQFILMPELRTIGASASTPAFVAETNPGDEDMGSWMSGLTVLQLDPTLCGIDVATRNPTTWIPSQTPSAVSWATPSNRLFDINANGTIRMVNVPSVSYGAGDFENGWVWRPTLVPERSIFVRAQYQICVQVSDAFGGVTRDTVTIAISAELPGTPMIRSVSPNTFPTIGAPVTFTGENFGQSGAGAFPVQAWYSNGRQSYNATGCTVLSNTQIRCNAVPGFGGSMTWLVRLNGRIVASENPIMASYNVPIVTGIVNHQNMSLQGANVIISGSDFGPAIPLTPLEVFYGPATNPRKYQCVPIVTGHTQFTCRSSNLGGGRNLVWSVVAGGQAATDQTGSTVWSYAFPRIDAISVPAGSAYSLTTLDTRGGQQIVITGAFFGSGAMGGPSLSVTYGGVNGRLLAFPACVRDALNPHGIIRCITAPGVGIGHVVLIEVEEQAPAAGVFRQGPGLAYSPPVVTRMFGPGYTRAATEGGQRIVLEGRGFGPMGLLGGVVPTIDSMVYGPGAGNLRYTATQCQVTVADQQITCLSTEGVGRGLVYSLTIGGQVQNTTNGVFGSGSYAPPNVAAFSGPGADDAITRGGQTMIIAGRNFGPADAYTNALLDVQYGSELQSPIRNATAVTIGSVRFNAASCSITVSHTELTCTTAEGAGENLVWDVTVASQRSATPTTKYHNPQINSITYKANGQPVLDANVDGGDWLVLTGDFFGPNNYPPGRDLISSVTYGVLGTEYTVPNRDWALVSHESLEVRLQPGSGANLIFRVVVADQVSESSLTARFSYALPDVLLLDPTPITTFNDPRAPVLCTAAVRNLPLLDPLTRIGLLYGSTNPRPITPNVPRGAQAIARARNTAGPLAGSVNITFPFPTHGGGLGVGVAITLSSAGSQAVSQISTLDSTSVIDYMDPVIDDIVVTRARFADNTTNLDESDLIACPFVGADFSCNQLEGVYEMSILGRHLTEDEPEWLDGVTRRWELLIRNETFAGEGEVWSDSVNAASGRPVTSSLLYMHEWTHTRIVLYYRRATRADASAIVGGTLRLTIGSISYMGPARQTVIRQFKEQNPEINAIRGNELPFPTAGGDLTNPVELTMENLNGALNLRATVGGRPAEILEKTGSSWVTLVNLANQAVPGANPDIASWLTRANQNGVWTVGIRVPPGQGLGQKVQLFKVTSDGPMGSTDRNTVDYRPPVMTSVQVVRRGVEGPVQTINFQTNVLVPTDGRSAVVRISGQNLGVEPKVLVGFGPVTIPSTAIRVCPGTTLPHTCYEFTAPEGEGNGLQHRLADGTTFVYPNGYELLLDAGGQTTGAVPFRFELPVTTSVTSVTGMYPTRGGVSLMIHGDNFGATALGQDEQVSVRFGRTFDTAPWNMCLNIDRISHTLINCTLPEGSGRSLAVAVNIAGQENVSPSVFSYNRPQITSVRVVDATTLEARADTSSTDEPLLSNRLVARGRTAGGDVLIITGQDFGAANPAVHCAFLSWAAREDPDGNRVHTCNGWEDFLGEGEIPASHWQAAAGNFTGLWTHEEIRILTPPGLGIKDIELSIRGQTLGMASFRVDPVGSRNIWRFVYNVPSIQGMFAGDLESIGRNQPMTKFETEGGETITLFGDNFGPSPFANNSFRSEVFNPNQVPLAVAPRLPTASIAFVFHRACVTDGVSLLGGFPAVSVPIRGPTIPTPFNSEMRDCQSSVSSRTHGRMVLQTGSGIGLNRTAYLVVMEPGFAAFSEQRLRSAPINFDFKPPQIQYFEPRPVAMRNEEVAVRIVGRNYGTVDVNVQNRQQWTAEERTVLATVSGITGSCRTSERNSRGTLTFIECDMDATIVPAGPRNVTVLAAGQTGRMEADDVSALLLVCAQGFYGRIGETCVPCPQQDEDLAKTGADCRGYIAPGRQMPAWSNSTGTPTGFRETDPVRFTYPVPRRGWYNLNSSDMYTRRVAGNPSMMSACPEGFQHMGRDVCIVPCDPPESCLQDNQCAEGYTSAAPYWRCGSCDRGYYRRAGECVKCPDSPAALFIGFILLVIAVAGVGFFLNRKQINIAVISIGVDFFQVLGIFGQARIKWPPAVKELLHILSAFNLNIEIVAPECLVPDISYRQKFWFIMVLPLCIAGLFGVNYVSLLAYKALILGQPKKMWHTHKPALVSSCLVLLYLLYLYLTRTIFDVFNCGPTFPSDGKLYLQVVPYEECGKAGGVQVTLLPYAFAGLAVYTIGYPAFIGYTLWKNREIVMEDQLLRARSTGNDKLTNPRAFDFRATFGRSYFQFKPDWCIWILAIILRKFFIAITAVVFGKNVSFQMAACLLIMFLAYAAQVQIRPYMSPGDFDEVIKSHNESCLSSAIHARLKSSLAGIESRGKKRARKNLITFEGKVDQAAIFGLLTGFFFNYNTVEAIMQFCAVIVCLMAIMYQANELNSFYPQSKDSVTVVLMIVIIWAIVYFFTVFVTEIVVLYNEDVRAQQLLKQQRNARAEKGGKKAAGDEDEQSRRNSRNMNLNAEGELNVGNVQAQNNPMFLNNNNTGNVSSETVAETILSQKDSPPAELWRVFQSSYVELNEQVKGLQEQLLAAKKQAQNAAATGGDDLARMNSSRATARTEFAPTTSKTEAFGSSNPLKSSASNKGLSLAATRKSVSTRKGADL